MKKQIQIPTTCPSCSAELERVNSQLFCRNTSCSAQSTKKVEAFVKKLRIKGLGPSSILKLGFVNPIEIYETSIDIYIEILGEKIGTKVFNEVQNSRTTTFATFLAALSIPLIGETASRKIATVVNSFKDILDDEWHNILGVIAQDNLYEWLESNIDDMLIFESYFTFNIPMKVKASKGNVCITGKLNDFSNRTKAKEFLEEQGYTVTTSISGKTNFLVCEDGSISSKSKKAESLEIPIVLIADLIKGK